MRGSVSASLPGFAGILAEGGPDMIAEGLPGHVESW